MNEGEHDSRNIFTKSTYYYNYQIRITTKLITCTTFKEKCENGKAETIKIRKLKS
jgi:hypothetical protein